MLVPAILCEAGLKNTFSQRICQSDMRFFHFQNFVDYDLIVDRNDWKRIQMVSIDPHGQLLAYFEARINREANIVEDLLVMSLRTSGLTNLANRDFFRFTASLLKDRGFRKVFFRYIKDNPAARQYQRLFGEIIQCGSIQGILEEYVTLTDGKIYDLVIMDIKREPYLRWFEDRYALHPTS